MSASINLPRNGSVIAPPPEGTLPYGGVGNLVISVASAADTIGPWGVNPRQRDAELRAFWPTEPLFSSALFTTISQYCSFSWSLKGPPRSVRVSQEILSNLQFGAGWEGLMEPFLIDYFTQDNGAFMEIVRTEDEPGAPVISLNHLDANRCERTGRPEQPVIYTDREARRHKLNWYNVAVLSEFPSPIEEAYGVGYCCLTRVLRAVQVMRDIGIVKQEKAGALTRQVHLVSGVQTRIIEDAMAQKQASAEAQGYLRYIQPLIVASLDPTSRVSKETIDLASIPEDWDEEKSLQAYITALAMAFGGDYQNFAPMPGSGLGTSTQSKVMNMKARGKGPGLFMKRMERLFNFHGLLPRTVTFEFGQQDIAQQMETAELRRSRALEREIRVRSGEITTEVARQMAVDFGDLDERYLLMMREENATETIAGDDTTPARDFSDEDIKPGMPGPEEPPGGQAEVGAPPGKSPSPTNTQNNRPRPVTTNQGRQPGGESDDEGLNIVARRGLSFSLTVLSSRARIVRTRALMRDLNKYDKATIDEIHEEVKEYPGKAYGSDYVRTKTLLRSWKKQNTSGGGRISWLLSNYARDPKGRYYANLVHGTMRPDPQWPQHADTGWKHIHDVVEDIGGRGFFRERAQRIVAKHIVDVRI